jgi:hypothetical protein
VAFVIATDGRHYERRCLGRGVLLFDDDELVEREKTRVAFARNGRRQICNVVEVPRAGVEPRRWWVCGDTSEGTSKNSDVREFVRI